VEVLELLVYLFAAILILVVVAIPFIMHHNREKEELNKPKQEEKEEKNILKHNYSGIYIEWRKKRHYLIGIKSTYDPAVDKLTEIKLCFGDPHILPTTRPPQVKEKPHQAS